MGNEVSVIPQQTGEAVSFQMMERMAQTVAKSGLFGMKTPEQALALMALAQAEGIHPMTAVRDFHIINNRPSLKADTMLARFQQAGGKVVWHALSDAKADATFSHPQGGTARIDWTIERAQRAGLANKDVWKGYPRAMLRSRVISEAIRTVLPGVIAGTYTPEEVLNLDPELPGSTDARIEQFGKSVGNDASEQFIRDIAAAADMEALKTAFSAAYKSAKDVGDELRQTTFKIVYDARKWALSQPAPVTVEPEPQAGEATEGGAENGEGSKP